MVHYLEMNWALMMVQHWEKEMEPNSMREKEMELVKVPKKVYQTVQPTDCWMVLEWSVYLRAPRKVRPMERVKLSEIGKGDK